MTEHTLKDLTDSVPTNLDMPLWQPYPQQRFYVAATSGLIGRSWIFGFIFVAAYIMSAFIEIPFLEEALLSIAVFLMADCFIGLAALNRDRYALTEHALYTREGWLFRTFSFTPLQKIQHVSTSQGPLQRLYGLSTLNIHCGTPSLEVTLDSLDTHEAMRMMQQIRERSLSENDDFSFTEADERSVSGADECR